MNAILVLFLRLIFLLLSYLFIGWMAYSIYIDLWGQKVGKQSKPIVAITLQTKIDQERVSKRFKIPEVTLGRDPACDFPIDDDTISLRHSKLSFHHKHWWVEDLNSTNGTFVNENRIEEPIVLTDDDRLRLGRKTVTININLATNGENNE